MNKFLLLLSLGLILAPCDTAKKIGVIKKGIQKQMPTTREKRFHYLKENYPYVNKDSTFCPSEYPYPFNNLKHCCSHINQSHPCPDQVHLHYKSLPECCPDNATLLCLSAPCKMHPNGLRKEKFSSFVVVTKDFTELLPDPGAGTQIELHPNAALSIQNIHTWSLDDGVLSCGGTFPTSAHTLDCFKLTMPSMEWITMPAMLYCVDLVYGFTFNNTAWIIGGQTGLHQRRKESQYFDRETNQWLLGPELDQPVFQQASVAISDTQFIISGGRDGNSNPTDQVLEYDSATGVFTPYIGGPLIYERIMHQMEKVTKADGSELLMVIGGSDYSNPGWNQGLIQVSHLPARTPWALDPSISELPNLLNAVPICTDNIFCFFVGSDRTETFEYEPESGTWIKHPELTSSAPHANYHNVAYFESERPICC